VERPWGRRTLRPAGIPSLVEPEAAGPLWIGSGTEAGAEQVHDLGDDEDGNDQWAWMGLQKFKAFPWRRPKRRPRSSSTPSAPGEGQGRSAVLPGAGPVPLP
jgi:hypothetical protein